MVKFYPSSFKGQIYFESEHKRLSLRSSFMKSLFKYVKQEPTKVTLVVILQLICSAFRVLNSLINVFILNSLIKLDFQAFFKYILLNILLFLVMTVFLISEQVLSVKTVQFLSLRLRQDIIEHIENYSVSRFEKNDTGVYTSWLTNDMNLVEENGFTNLFSMVQIFGDSVFSLIALIKFNWTFLPLVAILTLFTLGLPQLVRKKVASSNFTTSKENEKVVNVINDCLQGFATYNIFTAEQQIEKRITIAVKKLIGAKVRQAKYRSFNGSIAGASNVISQVIIQAWTGLLILEKQVTIGVINSSTSLAFNVFNSLAVIAPILTELQALNPIFSKYQLDEPVKGHDQAGSKIVDINITAKNLQIAYPPDKPVFKKPLNFTILDGQKIAVEGESGSGKSTLLKILAGRLTDYTGDLQLDKTEIKNIDNNTLRSNVVYIDQTAYLFNDTVRYNLELGQHFSDEEIESALEKADLWDFVSTLPQKLDTPVGEGGASLSGGQKQRLALARGLLRNRKLFLLDESTSSLDKAGAIKVENDFLNQPKITVVFVSHQLHEENKDKFDQIIAL